MNSSGEDGQRLCCNLEVVISRLLLQRQGVDAGTPYPASREPTATDSNHRAQLTLSSTWNKIFRHDRFRRMICFGRSRTYLLPRACRRDETPHDCRWSWRFAGHETPPAQRHPMDCVALAHHQNLRTRPFNRPEQQQPLLEMSLAAWAPLEFMPTRCWTGCRCPILSRA